MNKTISNLAETYFLKGKFAPRRVFNEQMIYELAMESYRKWNKPVKRKKIEVNQPGIITEVHEDYFVVTIPNLADFKINQQTEKNFI